MFKGVMQHLGALKELTPDECDRVTPVKIEYAVLGS